MNEIFNLESTAMNTRIYYSFIVYFFLFIQLVFSQATCYLPDGSVAYGDTPCGSILPATCCAGQCLSNGLCFTPSDNMLARSSCTDQSWESSVCTSYCKDSNTNAFEPISPCGGGLFCCGVGPGSGADECCASQSGFTLSNGNLVANPVPPVTITIISTAVLTNTVTIISASIEVHLETVTGGVETAAASLLTIIQTTIQTISKSVPILSTITVNNFANNPSPTNSEILTVICTGVPGSQTSSPSSTSLISSCPSCSKKETAIGAGIGVSLGFALLAALALLFWRKDRPFRTSQGAAVAAVPMPQNNHTHVYPPGMTNANTQSQTMWQESGGSYGSSRMDSPPMYHTGK